MYRAIGLCALESGVDPADEQAVVALVRGGGCRVNVRIAQGKQETLLNDRNVSPRLHEEAVGFAASTVSRYRDVRRHLVRAQQAIANAQPVGMDGRDIGTVVLPDAKLKIFLTADAAVRARRRCLQLGIAADSPQGKEIFHKLVERDKQDSERAVDPLRPAEDAVLVDTGNITFEEALNRLLALVEERYGIKNA